MKRKQLTIDDLKKICQKNDEEIFITDKYIFRKLSIYVTKLCIMLRISSNGATFLSLLFALAGVIFLASNKPTNLFLGAICIFIYWMLDYVDGELARFYISVGKQKPSLNGGYFDYLVHFFSSNLMFLSVGYALYNFYGNNIWIIMGTISCIGISNFPNLVAAMIIVKDINKAKEIDEKRKFILDLLDDGQSGKDAILGKNNLKKTVQLLKEVLLFPGCLNMVMLVSIIDAMSNNWLISGLNFRAIYLIIFTLIMLLNTIRKSIFWLNKMKIVN